MATGSRLPSRDDGLLALLALLWGIVDAHHSTSGKGSLIGALTFQSFANYSLCGYRILPSGLLLSRRRKRRYAERRRQWEEAYLAGSIDAPTLQADYAAAQAITAHADAAAWRWQQLRRRLLAQSLVAL